MDIREYRTYDAQEILALYGSVGWTAYTDRPEALKAGFDRSLLCLAAYEGKELVALLRAVGDGQTMVLLQDILVHPARQRQGIGTSLMITALSAAGGEKDIAVYLIANEKAIPFYEKLGMKKAADVMQYNHIDWTEFIVGKTV